MNASHIYIDYIFLFLQQYFPIEELLLGELDYDQHPIPDYSYKFLDIKNEYLSRTQTELRIYANSSTDRSMITSGTNFAEK